MVNKFEIGKVYFVALVSPWNTNEFQCNCRVSALTKPSELGEFSITENYKMNMEQSLRYVPDDTLILQVYRITSVEEKTIEDKPWYIPATIIDKNYSKEFVLVQHYTSTISESIRMLETDSEKVNFDKAMMAELTNILSRSKSYGNTKEKVNVVNNFTESYMYKDDYIVYDDIRDSNVAAINNVTKTMKRQDEKERIRANLIKNDMTESTRLAEEAKTQYEDTKRRYEELSASLVPIIAEYELKTKSVDAYYEYLVKWANDNGVPPPSSGGEYSEGDQ